MKENLINILLLIVGHNILNIDYIFFSNNLTLRKILKIPLGYKIDKEKFLPSKEFPSVHLKLYAEFFLQ